MKENKEEKFERIRDLTTRYQESKFDPKIFEEILAAVDKLLIDQIYKYESNEPKQTYPRFSSKANDSLIDPSVLNVQSRFPFLALKPYAVKSLQPHTTILFFSE